MSDATSGYHFTELIKTYVTAGRSVVPLVDLESKKPAVKWATFQHTRPDLNTVVGWFSGPRQYPGVAIITGRISGNLQGLDFDCKNDDGASHAAWLAEVERRAHGLVARLVSEQSRSGGMHYYFTCPDIAGGVTLAFTEPRPIYQAATGKTVMKGLPLIETKENGRYMACFPTPGYKQLHGNLKTVPTISPEERQILHDAARLQNKNLAEEKKAGKYTSDATMPGSEYSQKATIAAVLELLLEAGWTEIRRDSDESIWLERPGKSVGSTSANLKLIDGAPIFYCYTSSAPPFTEMKGHNAFTVLGFLKYDGDFKAAASALRNAGYGAQGEDGDSRDIPSMHEIGRAFAQAHAADLAYDGGADCMRMFDGKCWQESEVAHSGLERLAIQAIEHAGRKVNSPRQVNDMVHFAATHAHREFKAKPGLVNFLNGTFDVATGQLRKHSPSDNLTTCLPYEFSRGKHPETDKFYESSIPDPIARDAIKVHFGLALLRDTANRQHPVLIGGPNSGKTTTGNHGRAICGHNQNTFANAVIFQAEREGQHNRAIWKNDHLVVVDELPVAALRGEETVKLMLSHGGVPVRLLHQQPIRENTWRPKVIFTTNSDPKFLDPTGALRSRLIFIDFPNPRTDSPNEADPTKRVDKELWARLQAELPAFAKTCLEAAIDALKAGCYPMSDAMRARGDEIARGGDSIREFMFECCELMAESFVSTEALFTEYQVYCGCAELPCRSKQDFRQHLPASFPSVSHWRGRMGGSTSNPVQGWKGIALKTAWSHTYRPPFNVVGLKSA